MYIGLRLWFRIVTKGNSDVMVPVTRLPWSQSAIDTKLVAALFSQLSSPPRLSQVPPFLRSLLFCSAGQTVTLTLLLDTYSTSVANGGKLVSTRVPHSQEARL